MKRKWNVVGYTHMQLFGKNLPEDGQWAVWKDKLGHIEIARFKYDAQDHFFPQTKYIEEENVIAWRDLKRYRHKRYKRHKK